MSYKFKDNHGENEYATMLDALKDNRVFVVYSEDDGTFEIEESCDGNYHLKISAEQLADLGRELINLAEKK